MARINNVLLSAGIHGNEKTGIFLIKKFQKNPLLIQRESFRSQTLLINQKAIDLNQRYYEIDLNRCFALPTIDNPKAESYEELLAQKIYRQIKESAIDFVVDIHTSTSNMGLTLLLSNDNPFNLQLAAYLAVTNPLVKVVRTVNTTQTDRFRNIFSLGFTLEIGAIAPNVIDAVWFERAEVLIEEILDYIELTNRQQQPEIPQTITLYSLFKTVYFPTDDTGEITAMVHSQVHGNDYRGLSSGEPIFTKFDGSIITYPRSNTVYPIFINEAAYWENKIAMYFTTKKEISLSGNFIA